MRRRLALTKRRIGGAMRALAAIPTLRAPCMLLACFLSFPLDAFLL
jgi:hypothetical protein